jgi:glyceraldehyde 3-phosphate dehydrogenase
MKTSNGVNIAINGFGRIGRAVFKIILDKYPKAKIVAINDLTDVATLAHLLEYDTCYGKYSKEVSQKGDNLVVAGESYKILAQTNPEELPWEELKVDIVLECTGRFRLKEEVSAHLRAGAKKVIISAPTKSKEIKTVVLGVNENVINKNDEILSMASCTTNCLAPVTDIMRGNFGLVKAIMTTVHSYTADQNIVDGPHKDLRRARAAAVNIVPTTTGAAVATIETIPSLKDKFDGLAIRVPTPVVSLCDIVFVTKKKTSVEEVNNIIKKESKNQKYKTIVNITEKDLVSSDFIGNPASAIVDLPLTKVVGGDLVKVIAWYDNEWGYSNRLADLVEYIVKKRLL